MSRRSLYFRKKLLQAGQVITRSRGSRQKEMEHRVQRIPYDHLAALSGMMFSAHKKPKDAKVQRLAARYS
jgi:hypothetical protein